MKTLTNHILEKLLINKDFKSVCPPCTRNDFLNAEHIVVMDMSDDYSGGSSVWLTISIVKINKLKKEFKKYIISGTDCIFDDAAWNLTTYMYEDMNGLLCTNYNESENYIVLPLSYFKTYFNYYDIFEKLSNSKTISIKDVGKLFNLKNLTKYVKEYAMIGHNTFFITDFVTKYVDEYIKFIDEHDK